MAARSSARGRGVLAQIEGQFDAALGHYRAALAEAQAGGERRRAALYLYNIATVQAAVGDNDGALRTLEHASSVELGQSHVFALVLTAGQAHSGPLPAET